MTITLDPAQQQAAATVAGVASQLGVSTPLAEAVAWHESGLNPTAVGDHGTSFGLFQLHQGGELGSLTPQQAFNPTTNADVALTRIAQVAHAMPGADPGIIAADAQRPAVPYAYARAVDALIPQFGGSSTGVTATASPATSSPTTAGTQQTGFVSNALGISKLVADMPTWIATGFGILIGGGLIAAGAYALVGKSSAGHAAESSAGALAPLMLA